MAKSKKGIEGKVLRQELKENTEMIQENLEKGSQYEHDKVMLENQIEMIQNSDLAAEDKSEQLQMLEEGIEKLRAEHDEIEQNVKEIQGDSWEIIETLTDNVQTLEAQKQKMTEAKLESGAVDMNKAIEATGKKQEEFSSLAEEEKTKLQASIDTMNAQKRSMLRNAFSKR